MAIGEGKKDGLLSPRRVSRVYDSHFEASTQGGTTARILAFSGGVGLIVCSLTLWFHWIVHGSFSWLQMCVSTTAFVVGILNLVLECNLPCVETVRGAITNQAPIFGKVTGRGSMYAAAGILQCIIFRPVHLVVGFFTAAVGIYMINVGRRANACLSTLKKSITDEKALKIAFHNNDRNGDGALEAFEFDGLILALGIELDNDELEAAFSSIDTNNDKKIVYDEFRTWWKACTAEAEAGIA
ncbi:hypothetical protein ACHAWF_009775 [Thalassiosira exigua]